ncbi:MAG: hypothetical protein OXI55_10355 [Gammaproteobacteria bacterium]|nr:hypothetical protein [Gammaproteobacteria bacterium]
MSNDDLHLQVFINPLAFLPLLVPSHNTASPEPSAESVLEFLCAPGMDSSVAAIVGRYREISATPEPHFAPAVERVLDKLIWPLRYAKGAYILGNYLGTITHCGMVAEMLAILTFEMAEPKLNGEGMTDRSQKDLFGRSFEKLGQERRVSILYAYGMIDDDLKRSFDRIRTIRREYLHQWSKDIGKLSTDAVDCYEHAVKIVDFVLGQTIRDGKVVLEPKLTRYLRAQGVLVAAGD